MDGHSDRLAEYDLNTSVCIQHGITPRLLLARREPLPRLHPLEQIRFPVTDRAADPDVRWSISAHPRLGQPRKTDLQTGGRLLRSEEDESGYGRFLRHRGAGESRLRAHSIPLAGYAAPRGATARTSGLSPANLGQAQREITSTKMVSFRGIFVVCRPSGGEGSALNVCRGPPGWGNACPGTEMTPGLVPRPKAIQSGHP
jgi:hypothetical protein